MDQLKAKLIEYQQSSELERNLLYARYIHKEILPLVECEVIGRCNSDYSEYIQEMLTGFLKWIVNINLEPVKNIKGFLRRIFKCRLIDYIRKEEKRTNRFICFSDHVA